METEIEEVEQRCAVVRAVMEIEDADIRANVLRTVLTSLEGADEAVMLQTLRSFSNDHPLVKAWLKQQQLQLQFHEREVTTIRSRLAALGVTPQK